MAIAEQFRAAVRRVSSFARGAQEPSKLLQFPDVFAQEQEDLKLRRHIAEALRNETTALPSEGPAAGLAFSGGGIRSATFCLGLLQALARSPHLLTRFDYLSTVSGGGFTGGWWMAWLTRHLQRGEGAPPSLFPGPEDVSLGAAGAQGTGALAGKDPVRFLRLFSNYLTPRRGAFSQDTWRAVAVMSRNLVLTWLSVLPLFFAAICFVQAPLGLLRGFGDSGATSDVAGSWSARWSSVRPVFSWFGGVAAALFTLETVAWLIVAAKFGHRPRTAVVRDGQEASDADSGVRFGRILATAVAQSLFVALIIFHPTVGDLVHWPFGVRGAVDASMFVTWGAVLGALLLVYLGLAAYKPLNDRRDMIRSFIVRIHAATLVTAVCVGLVLAFAAFGDLAWRSTVAAGEWGLAKAGGLAGLALTLGGTLYSAFTAAPAGSGDAREREEQGARRSSRARSIVLAVSPWLVVAVLGCLGAWLARAAFEQVHLTIVEFVPRLEVERTLNLPHLYSWVVVGALAGAALALMMGFAELGSAPWMIPLVIGMLVLWVARLQIDAVPPWLLNLAITAVATLLTVGALGRSREGVQAPRRLRTRAIVVGSVAVAAVAAAWWAIPSTAPAPEVRQGDVRDAATLTLFAAVVAARFVAARRMPSLVIVLLGFTTGVACAIAVASLQPVTVLASWDFTVFVAMGGTALAGALAIGWMVDPNLVSLHGFYRDRLVRAYLGASNDRRTGSDAQVTDAVPGDDVPLAEVRTDLLGGPIPLVNTTLNLLGARDLGIVQRRSASFTLSPLHCGSTRTGFRPTASYMSGSLTLGGAIAVSGAAASPAMGTLHVSGAQAMLLTLLNIRLGFWAPNPAEHSWRLPQARLWTLAMIRELLSQTDETSSYCYLTDGGHFDNTGIYPLVQRACRLIVAVDCGRDSDPPQFGDLAQAIRLSRIDFGAEIALDRDGAKDELTPVIVRGRIHYSDEHLRLLNLPADRAEGVIVCIKPGLWLEGALPVDVLQYRSAHPEFPQQSTADQWFDEAQFESYRRLGMSIGAAAEKRICEELDRPCGETGGPALRDEVRAHH